MKSPPTCTYLNRKAFFASRQLIDQYHLPSFSRLPNEKHPSILLQPNSFLNPIKGAADSEE